MSDEVLKYFKELTDGNVVIMGSKTFFSIPVKFRPLKNRLNLVLTNNKDLLKNDKITFLVIKLITITTREIEATIITVAKPWETTSLKPLDVKKLTISS